MQILDELAKANLKSNAAKNKSKAMTSIKFSDTSG